MLLHIRLHVSALDIPWQVQYIKILTEHYDDYSVMSNHGHSQTDCTSHDHPNLRQIIANAQRCMLNDTHTRNMHKTQHVFLKYFQQ